ncbi:DNA polymerase II [Vibrio aerogenes CECT 7868]|uniref:DNA polymerase n=1 Tax=Vibrio aerogenes CECT 7868 TaxID=1216006 RepID=A0A1M6DT98_9VIBR|nr:DNA polymerase II [Vibrio aerogenes]SHI76432.1 DNA polymerase II [Vibrio aerogenes CECT 7868]
MTIEKGFLLTRHSRDYGDKTRIELWVSTTQGPVRILIDDEQPVCFITRSDKDRLQQALSNQCDNVTYKDLPLRDFNSAPVTACYLPTLRAAQNFCEQCRQENIEVLENDIRLPDRYLMERFICGSLEFTGTITQKASHRMVTQAKCRKGDFHPDLRSVSLDIECSEKGELYSVGLDCDNDARVIMIGSPGEISQVPCDFHIEWVSDEAELLQALNHWFNIYDPDIIIGWNVVDFDLRLLNQRAEKHHLKLRLGRDQQTMSFRTSGQSQKSFVYIPGRVVLDGIDALKTATYHFSSWSLESVSQALLNEGKAIHNVHNRMEEINTMFKHDKISLAIYNLKDCQLVRRIFAHTHLLDFMIQRSKLTGLELDRIGGSVAAFTNLYLPQLHRAGYIAPSLVSENWQASPGGYVMDSVPGLYDSVIVLDFKSLYPSIIRTFLIDPLGLIEGLKLTAGKEDDQAVPGFRGGQFHRTRHFLPKMIESLWQARDIAKKNREAAFSQAIKIIMNSFYGVLGSSGCRFFDTRLASSITMRGHEIMKQTRQLIEASGYKVIYGDTDSTFVSLEKNYTAAEADETGRLLTDSINQWWKQHLKETYRLESCLEIEYETHYRKFFMPTIRGSETGSKKRYAGLTGSGDKEQMIFKGLESVRTDWTPLAQRFQKQLYHRIFHDENPSDYVRTFVEKTLAGEFDHELVYRKRLRRRLNEYKKNIPPQVRAARLADEQHRRMGKPLRYQNRGTIEYVMTINGPEPLEFRVSLLDYQHYIDKQLKPVADAILPFIGCQFDDLTKPQLGLF